jgi:DNA-binding transcriptional LysR family regulator
MRSGAVDPRYLLDNLPKVLAFSSVVRRGSVRAAARELRLSQPALSRSVAALEAALGAPLLERSRAGVRPTAAGAAVAAMADGLRQLAGDAAQELARAERGTTPHGTLRCVCHEVIAGYLWPLALASAERLAPRLRLGLETVCSSAAMRQRVEDGDADLALGAELKATSGLVATPLYRDDYGLFAGPDATLPEARSLGELRGAPLIFFGDSIGGRGETLSEALQAAGYRAPTRYPVSSYEAIVSMAMAGLGIAVLPRRPFARHVAHGLLREVRFGTRRAGVGDYAVVALARKDGGASALAAYAVERILGPAVVR